MKEINELNGLLKSNPAIRLNWTNSWTKTLTWKC